MTAFIFTGGGICPEYITERPGADDICIAADAGYKNALLLGMRVDLLVGDLDTLKQEELGGNIDCECVRVPAEKDFSDTHLAVSEAIKRGANRIVIIGGLDGRLDHTLSNLAILEDLCKKNVRALMTDGKNRVRLIRSSSELIARSAFVYLSIIAADKKVRGVSIEGCKYPLKNATLCSDYQYAISNEIEKNCALISVRKGGIYIIESRDA